MANDVKHVMQTGPAQQKSLLIAQGAVYRTGIGESANLMRANLHADVLAKNAINHIVANASAALHNLFDLKSFTSGNLRTLLPLLVSGVSLVAKRKALIKPVLVGAVALAAAGAVVFFLARKKSWLRLRYGNA